MPNTKTPPTPGPLSELEREALNREAAQRMAESAPDPAAAKAALDLANDPLAADADAIWGNADPAVERLAVAVDRFLQVRADVPLGFDELAEQIGAEDRQLLARALNWALLHQRIDRLTDGRFTPHEPGRR